MSIQCVCQNGHVLHVKESFAGSAGLCPTCRTRVEVPRLRRHPDMSEDAILDLLGKQSPAAVATATSCEEYESTSPSGIHGKSTPKKSCDRCNQEVSAGTHICPYCHTYIANLSDF
jgi:hypothetical protein